MADFIDEVYLLVLIILRLFLVICLETWNSSKARENKVMEKPNRYQRKCLRL